MQVVESIWYPTLIRDTYSAIKGRGIHDGVRRIKKALRDVENTRYCLKADVRKFYPSVNNEIMKRIIRNKIKDKDLLWLLDEIIDSTKGLPIGNYLSQYFGNLYLSGLDHWIKENQRQRYYFRYCDDIVILSDSKTYLHDLRKRIAEYLETNLDLRLKNNWQVFPVECRGIDFLGYRFFHGYTLLRKSIVKRFKRKIQYINEHWKRMDYEAIVNSIMSYYGWALYANCKNLFNQYLNDDLFWVVKQVSRANKKVNPLQGLA